MKYNTKILYPNKTRETITWSKANLSLLYAFGFKAKKDGFGEFCKIKIYWKGELIEIIRKFRIVDFLKRRGANIRLGKHADKKINIDFKDKL